MVAKNDTVIQLLRSKRLNVTDIRLQLLHLLLEPGTALSQKELEERMSSEGHSVDRVTLYRSIRTLLDKQVIHPITIDAQTVKYKLAGDHKKSDHPHFLCSHCQRMICMPQLSPSTKDLPEGFTLQSAQLLLEGLCPHCSLTTKQKDSEGE